MGSACCVAARNRTITNGWSNESNRGSLPAINEQMETSHSHRERQSFDSEFLNLNSDKIHSRTSGRVPSSPSIDMQTCGICSVLLTKRTYCGTYKIMANEVAVVAILICGHVYHSECLENMTSDINKYDPACPVCTFGEKKVIKMSEKADLVLKASNNKKSRRRVVDGDDIMFDHHRLSSSMRSLSGKRFLKRHFSFGFNGSRSLSDNNFPRKKGFFWSKSSKE